MTKQIEIFADGSCIGNPGPGGYGTIVRLDGESIELRGGEKQSTNNRMEMSALLAAFKFLISRDVRDASIKVYSDSRLVINTFKLNWKKKENKDIWALLEAAHLQLIGLQNRFEWNWVKGHAGHKENERCDEIALGEAKKYMRA